MTMKNEKATKHFFPQEAIESKILFLRGKKVIPEKISYITNNSYPQSRSPLRVTYSVDK